MAVYGGGRWRKRVGVGSAWERQEWWWSGVVVADDGGWSGGVLAVAVTMFTRVVTATSRSVLTDRCFYAQKGYLVQWL